MCNTWGWEQKYAKFGPDTQILLIFYKKLPQNDGINTMADLLRLSEGKLIYTLASALIMIKYSFAYKLKKN